MANPSTPTHKDEEDADGGENNTRKRERDDRRRLALRFAEDVLTLTRSGLAKESEDLG